ncbi:MAG: hypothetical protein ACKPKO_38320, partial [Candidatus Fonsibacter sp.]
MLDALQQQPYNTNEVRRMVGGFLDNVRSGPGWIQSKLPAVRGVLEHVPHRYAQTGVKRTEGSGPRQGAKTDRPPTNMMQRNAYRKKL